MAIVYPITQGAKALDEAYALLAALRTENAALFTLGEILWIADDDRRVRFSNDEQSQRFLNDVRCISERVEQRKKQTLR